MQSLYISIQLSLLKYKYQGLQDEVLFKRHVEWAIASSNGRLGDLDQLSCWG